MAHQPIWRPDPPEFRQGTDEVPSVNPSPTGGADDQDAGLFLAHLATTLAQHGGGTASADLALDLVLHEIADQARLATNANGAAIALLRGDELVCRATSGEHAPLLGARLSTNSGLSGACIQTREVQRCDDTESDPRVDPAACRELTIGSLLVLPVAGDGLDVLGVFEIFSARARAFGDRDVLTVQALSRRIVDNVLRAAEADPVQLGAPAPVLDEEVAPPKLSQPQAQLPAPRIILLEPEPGAGTRDYWTGILTVIVVLLALFLGWMVGREGWRTAKNEVSPSAPAAQVPEPPQTPALKEVLTPTSPKARAGRAESSASKATPALTRSSQTAVQPGGLIVYEKGKVIFQLSPGVKDRPSAAGKGSAERNTVSEAPGNRASAAPKLVPSEVGNALLIRRIEPRYPEAARRGHVQGPVVLEVRVGDDGRVGEVSTVSGDPDLAAAAAQAVKKWEFRPYLEKGKPVEFLTTITVKFALPEEASSGDH